MEYLARRIPYNYQNKVQQFFDQKKLFCLYLGFFTIVLKQQATKVIIQVYFYLTIYYLNYY